jgi:hypothetical protein
MTARRNHVLPAPAVKTSVERRMFMKRAVYLAPVVLTFKAAPAFAKPGSIKRIAPPHGQKVR